MRTRDGRQATLGMNRRSRNASTSVAPNAQTITGPVGRSYLNENASPVAEASTPASQERAARAFDWW